MILGFPDLQVNIVPFKVGPFRMYTLGPALLPVLDVSVDFPFRDAVQHHLKFKLNLCDILESLCPCLDIYLWEQECRDEVSVHFGLILLVLAHVWFCVVLFMVFIQQIGLKFLSILQFA